MALVQCGGSGIVGGGSSAPRGGSGVIWGCCEVCTIWGGSWCTAPPPAHGAMHEDPPSPPKCNGASPVHEGDEEINGGGGEGRGIRSSVARGAVARALPPAPWRWWRCTRRWWWRCTRNCRTRTAPIPLHEALLPQQLRHEEFHPVLLCDELPHDASPLPLHEELMHEELMHEASRSRCTRGRCTRGRCTRVSRSWCTRIHCARSVESCRPGARGAVARGEPPVLVHGEVMREQAMREAPPPPKSWCTRSCCTRGRW